MQFLPTVNLWDPEVDEKLRNGEVSLQPGQWVQCGPGPKSRFCGVTPSGTIIATHHDGKSVKMSKFKQHLQYAASRI